MANVTSCFSTCSAPSQPLLELLLWGEIPFRLWVHRQKSWTKPRQKSEEFSSLLFTVTSTASPWDSYFFKLTQPLTISVKEKGGKPNRKSCSLPYGLWNSYRNLKSENYQDYVQKPEIVRYEFSFWRRERGVGQYSVFCGQR